ncbi:Monopolin complex subunit Csm1/Pcs1 [Penicillium soppii]|uniref:Monopolin complex subunit Csm1/Pcs1 n=1 Tax=Penicillium soppii TaxID=69789 RepID=UPI00254660B7|nr:Monopolin complex subunit Csm1/Pcs1 [Penicillium soppii]KAJ5860700.1 Monopolin complex subunit Csm1/Pcs1 [Penicillium soppii]
MPKRKATSQISGLMSSDDEDLIQMHKETDTHEEPPAKKRRGRPRTSNENVTETKPTKPTTRAKKQHVAADKTENSTGKKPARRGRPKGSSRVSQDAETPATAETEEMEPEAAAPDQENEDPRALKETKKPPTKATKAKAATVATRGRGRGKQLQTDGEFEFTPSGTRHTSAPETREEATEPSPLSRGTLRGKKVPEVEETQQNTESAADLIEESGPPNLLAFQCPRRRTALGYPCVDSEQGGDPELRRRLGELTKKNDALEIKYRNLREIGIVEANANMEKLRKQTETITTASNELVASLKAELEAQRKLGTQSRGLQKQLKDRDSDVARLQANADEARAQLASAQSEIKALQTKLAAARNTAASVEGASKIPGSAIKGGGTNRANAAANAEAAQAAQLAQLKEDLYSDLTGLIIRDVKNRDSDHVYDCIQTGINGTLHFHLAVPKESADFNNTEFQYLPLLDANRDRDLVNMLPDFLAVDITFKRGQAAKFYTRVIDALTKRRSLPA